MNYTDRETPFTRIIEHKHFEFGQQEKTVISEEYSREWHTGDEAYYPINDNKNNAIYDKYERLTKKHTCIIFGGRLGEYKYYNMDEIIKKSLYAIKCELQLINNLI